LIVAQGNRYEENHRWIWSKSFFLGCGQDPKEINARLQKQFDCQRIVEKRFNADVDECKQSSTFSACYDIAMDKLKQETLNCAKLDEH